MGLSCDQMQGSHGQKTQRKGPGDKSAETVNDRNEGQRDEEKRDREQGHWANLSMSYPVVYEVYSEKFR